MREEKNTPMVFGKAAYVKEEKKLVVPTPEEEEARKAEKPSEEAPPVKEEEKGEQLSTVVMQTAKEEDDSMQVPSMEEDEPKNAIAQQQPHDDATVKNEAEEHAGAVPVVTEAVQVKSEAEGQTTEALPAFYAELMGEGQPESNGTLSLDNTFYGSQVPQLIDFDGDLCRNGDCEGRGTD
jgi:hypothetical protein